MIHPLPRKIVYRYGEHQQLFVNYLQVTFQHGLPDTSDFDGSEPVLLVIDDLMNETDQSISNLFKKRFASS